MSEEMNELPEELRALERQLAGISPAAAANREAMLFEAGRRAGKKASHVRLWQGLCGGLAAALLCVAALPRMSERGAGVVRNEEPPRQVVPKLVQSAPPVAAPQEAEAVPPRPLPAVGLASNYLALRNLVLAEGVGALPATSTEGYSPGPAPAADDALKSLPAWQRRMELDQGGRL